MFGTATPKTRAADSTDQAFHPIFSADRPLLADGREVTDTNGQMQQQRGEAGIHVLLILMGHERHKVCGREDLRPCQPFARHRSRSADEHREDGADARPLCPVAVQQHYVVAPAPRCSPKNAKTRLHASSAAARL